MTEQDMGRLSDNTVRRLQDKGFLGKATLQAQLVARCILCPSRDPSKPLYGYEIMQSTGLKSGTVYPILTQFANRNVLQNRRTEPQ